MYSICSGFKSGRYGGVTSERLSAPGYRAAQFLLARQIKPLILWHLLRGIKREEWEIAGKRYVNTGYVSIIVCYRV